MNTVLIILIGLAAAATGFVLVKGVITMAQGRDITGAQSNRLMSMRVAFQLLTIVLVLILLMVGGRGLPG